MLTKTSEISYKKGYLLDPYPIEDGRVANPYSSSLSLTVGVDNVANTMEEKVKKVFSFTPDDQKNCAVKGGWFKRLLIGVSVLMGTGALATGGYYCYMMGRASTNTLIRPETTSPPDFANSPDIVETFVQNLSPIQNNELQEAARSEALRSPYSYYEAKNNMASSTISPLPSRTTIDDLTVISDQFLIKDPPTDNENDEQDHDRSESQDTDSKIIPKNTYFPLNNNFDKELARFCLSTVNDIVIKSYKTDPEYRCELLGNIVEKIFYYKNMYSVLQEMNMGRDDLTVDEKDNELLAKKKLSILYLAAEYIIDETEILSFYINAMKDNKNYTDTELRRREDYIMSYFSTYEPEGSC